MNPATENSHRFTALNPSLLSRREISLLGRIGALEVRRAISRREIAAAQALRYKVFVEEMGAVLPAAAMRARRDCDHVDSYCDHLLVIDTGIEGAVEDQIVGTYRLLRQDVAARHAGFYSQSEYDVAAMMRRQPGKRFMELGRSCVLPAYRTRRTIELLWQGNWAYALAHGIDAMFGCASFPGARPHAHALALSFLYHNAAAEGIWDVKPIDGLGVGMDMMPPEAIMPRAAINTMPPLIKGYLRLGARTSRAAVADVAFNTTDILVVLPVGEINPRYVNHYGSDAGRFAA
ncbi:GNAT family N-acetyltransferase [Pseudohoeflea coraliihabitans]|uniref:GNAT family N-acetyltransferase n=1 Tax=Pseudohoeflea coraliihabitans TaxID=2860393 RepID=A0ABS6WQD8_9HYPH|nr:GNAT family N-acetyltransferase [Pseudohoeflea sp. DP4N28-3]MBW3097602.1 GNAT family N-acetyltransferase [Pseudohoeflea sp. DP4N28-3]